MAPPSNIPYGAPVSTWRTTTYPALSPNRPELSAKGKTLVVTGGGSGIGAETAMFFAEAGVARIALLGRREQPLLDTKAVINKKFPQVEVFTASTDIKKKDQVDSAFAKFAGNGKVDVLISGACDNGPVEGIADVNPEEFIESVSSNVAGATYISQAFLRHAAKDAVVVNVSSCGMHLNFGPYLAAYGVIKQAVYRIWDCVGVAKPDMSVFHIQPGVVDTDMNRAVNGIKALGMEDNVSLPASFNVWLASPEARFLKGKFLWVNWDVEELKARAEELENSQELNIQLGGWPFGKPDWLAGFATPVNF